jgi:hypothetical protein
VRGKRIVNDPRARDKPCLRCGYSLRKLEEARHCPECGLAVWLSLNGNDSLEFSNPLWLRRQSLACGLLALAQSVASLTWSAFFAAWLFAPPDRLEFYLSPKWFYVAQDAYLLLFAIPLFMLETHERRYPDTLKVLRRTLLVFGVLGLALGAWMLWSDLGEPTEPARAAVFQYGRMRTSMLVFIGAIPVFLYLR